MAADDIFQRPEVVADPYPTYRRLRETEPVWWSEPRRAWVLTRFADVHEALRDPRLSTQRMSGFMAHMSAADQARFEPLSRNFSLQLLRLDPPDHTRLRSLVNKAFTPRVVEGMRTHIQAIVDGLLDAAAPAGRLDLIADLAYPLPVTVIAELLGLPADQQEQFKRWSDDIAGIVGSGPPRVEAAERAQSSLLAFAEYFQAVVAERRRRPGDDLLSALVAVEERGDTLTEEELLATVIIIFVAGHETTTNLIGNGTLALLRHPEQWQRLRDEPALIGSAVEECLRYDAPVQYTSRLATEAFEIGGQRIEAGQRVLPFMGAANRDPAQFPAPDRLDITRQPNRHIAFGFGPHFCLGAGLARLEGQTAIGTLARRFPNLRLTSDELTWRPNLGLHGLTALPLTV